MIVSSATLAEGNLQLAELLFMVAFVLFVLGALLAIADAAHPRQRGSTVVTALALTGLALLSLAWVVL